MTELEQRHTTPRSLPELERVYAREVVGEDLRMRRKELEQGAEMLWSLVAGELKRGNER